MKLYLPINGQACQFNQLRTMLVGVASLLLITSCDKVNELVDRVKHIGGPSEAHAGVEPMNHEQAKALIAAESKLVMIEFYTDT